MPVTKKATGETEAAVPMTASEAKKAKQERQYLKNRRYILTPADYRKRVVDPLVKQANRLLLTALALGTSSGTVDGAQVEEDKAVEAIRKRFTSMKDVYSKKLRGLTAYHTPLYRVAGKRAEKIATGQPLKPRASTMHRSVATFRPAVYNFIREAAEQNESLAPAAQSATFKDGPLKGYMSPSYAAQFILAYVASNRRFNKQNGQYIQPDALMEKHLGEGINAVLAKIAADKNPRAQEKARNFPGQFTFCKLQELIGFYRVKPAEGSAEEKSLDALRKNEAHWSVLQADFDAMSKIREDAYSRLHAAEPRPVKVAGTKGPRGPLSEAQKIARRVKRDANAAANALGYDLVPRKVEEPSA